MGDSLGLVGKRLLLLFRDGASAAGTEPEQAIWKQNWVRGTVRAVSVIGLASPGVEVSGGEGTTTTAAAGLTVFVEFEDCPWTQRSWVQVYSEEVRTVLVESSIVWAARSDPNLSGGGVTPISVWPALIEKDIRHSLLQEQPPLQTAVSLWCSDFELQEILRKGSFTLQGRRVRVYQPEFEEPWALGLVSQHNLVSHIMEITMEQGKATQVVDPRVIHVMLAEDVSEESQAGMLGHRRKECDGGKGESGRRRRNVSESDGDTTLKRFKGAGEGDAEGQNGGSSSEGMEESMVTWGGGGRLGSNSSNIISKVPDMSFPQGQGSPNPGASQGQPTLCFATYTKENGRTLVVQDRPASGDSTAPLAPTPPPLKAAPSPFSNTSFPSLGQMPSLVPGTSPKPTAVSVPEREKEGVLPGFSSAAALVSPAPIAASTSSHLSEGGTPNMGPAAPLSFSQNPPSWGGAQTENSKTTLATAGFRLPQSKPLSKEPPTLFKPSAPSDSLKKAGLAPASTGLFGPAQGPALAPHKETLKVPETQLSGNGMVLNKPFGVDNMPKLSPAFPGGISPGTLRGSGLSIGALGTGGLGGANTSGSGNGAGMVGALGLLTKAQGSETHENLFLQASKRDEPTNPFLAFAEKLSHSPFSGLPAPQTPASTISSSSAPSASSSVISGSPEADSLIAPAENKPNLFTMLEQPKGLLSSPFNALSSGSGSSSSAAPVPASMHTQKHQSALPETSQMSRQSGEGLGVKTVPDGTAEGGMIEQQAVAASGFSLFTGSSTIGGNGDAPQKFSLEERGISSKRDSDSSTNSDLSDLSETEEVLDGKQDPGPQGAAGEEKSKGKGVGKSRPRNKPFKVGQSVLKDQSKVRRLKQSGESFLQDGSCINVAPHLHKCRECRLERYRKFREQEPEDDDPNVACRFFHFRRLAFTRKGVLRVEGFLNPQQSDPLAMGLWLPSPSVQEGLDLDTSKYILANVGDQFCQLVMSEKEAMMMVEPHRQPHEPQNLMPTQIIPGTALYNIGDMVHAARGKWGIKANCPCTSRHTKPLVRPSAPNGLSQSGVNSNSVGAATPRTEGETTTTPSSSTVKSELAAEGGGEATGGACDVSGNNVPPSTKESRSLGGDSASSSALHWLADLATQKAKEETKDPGSLRSVMNRDSRSPFGLDSFSSLSKPSSSSTSTPKLFNSLLLGSSTSQPKTEGSSLRDLLNSGPGKLPQGPSDTGVPFPSVFSTSSVGDKSKGGLPNFLDHIIASVVETKKAELRRSGTEAGEVGSVGRRDGVMGLSVLDPHTSHSWLCDGRLLCLQDPSNGNNWKIFRECWKQGQPVLVSGIHKRLKGGLWRPEAFSQEFGDQDVDLVNCRNCAIISDVKVRDFWDGFQVISKRLQGGDGQPMVLKLKDWPPGEDFRDMMPTRHYYRKSSLHKVLL
ncbi:hypothetical protein JZ751_007065 [Albula glossodonta]|uniref:Lysine-specific demethylase n=1 Tax=Albula glossodonta TaxID=121402 RepID=A0A8T2PB60_9TELE|nr:hypothetical protein JZ751_007065 [Albula glossodonta]